MDVSKLPKSLQTITSYFEEYITSYNKSIYLQFRKVCVNAYLIATDIYTKEGVSPITPSSWKHNFFEVRFFIHDKYKIIVIAAFSPKYIKEPCILTEVSSDDLKEMMSILDNFYNIHNEKKGDKK